MDQKLYQCMLKNLEHDCQALLYYSKKTNEILFANKQALLHFADKTGKIDFAEVFQYDVSNELFQTLIIEQLTKTDSAILYDISATTNACENKSCDIQVGYADESTLTLFIEISFNDGIDQRSDRDLTATCYKADLPDIDEMLYQFMRTNLDRSYQALLYVDKNKRYPFFANRQAVDLFSDKKGKIDFHTMLEQYESKMFLKDMIGEQLEIADSALLHDVSTVTNKGKIKLCNMQVGYADEENSILFVELLFKEDAF